MIKSFQAFDKFLAKRGINDPYQDCCRLLPPRDSIAFEVNYHEPNIVFIPEEIKPIDVKEIMFTEVSNVETPKAIETVNKKKHKKNKKRKFDKENASIE